MADETTLRMVRVLRLAPEHPITWPEELEPDLQWIRERYNALKWESASFREAFEQAQAEWVDRLRATSDAAA